MSEDPTRLVDDPEAGDLLRDDLEVAGKAKLDGFDKAAGLIALQAAVAATAATATTTAAMMIFFLRAASSSGVRTRLTGSDGAAPMPAASRTDCSSSRCRSTLAAAARRRSSEVSR